MRIPSMPPLHKSAAYGQLLVGAAFDGRPAGPATGAPLTRAAPTVLPGDEAMMARCIELARLAVADGEYPFGSVIALDGEIVAEAVNTTIRASDVTRHAEIAALSQAQRTIGRVGLRRATLYSNIEPCAMCAYCIRESWVGRVVFALASPVMGGMSRWNILRDDGLSGRIPEVFGAAPEVVSGVLLREAQEAWREWSPFAWQMIRLRGLLTAPPAQDDQVRVRPAHCPSLWHHLALLLLGSRRPRSRIALPPRHGIV
jgi:tRNA(adenine34) deaminase